MAAAFMLAMTMEAQEIFPGKLQVHFEAEIGHGQVKRRPVKVLWHNKADAPSMTLSSSGNHYENYADTEERPPYGHPAMVLMGEEYFEKEQCDVLTQTYFIVAGHDGTGNFPRDANLISINGKRLIYGKEGTTLFGSDFDCEIKIYGDDRQENTKPEEYVGKPHSFGPISKQKIIIVSLKDTVRAREFVLGASPERDQCWTGVVSEVMIYNKPMSRYETDEVGKYLANKYLVKADKKKVITVDFSKKSKKPSMTGFLHGYNNKMPPSEIIKPLEPQLFRYSYTRTGYKWLDADEESDKKPYISSTYDENIKDAEMQPIFGESWGHPKYTWDEDYIWEKNPADHPEAFQRCVRYVINKTVESGAKKVSYDAWNEPDFPMFFSGGREKLFKAYEIAYHIVREEAPEGHRMAGPSLFKYDKEYIIDFLEYCLEHKLEVDILCWHEIHPTIPAIALHLQDIQETVLDNPRYDPLKIQEVHINEWGHYTDQYRPGDILGYLYYLETYGADKAAKACWPDTRNSSNCGNNTLCGIVTPVGWQPRSAWWAMKLYADGQATRAPSTTDDPRTVALASNIVDGHAQVLLGYFDFADAPYTCDIELQLNGLDKLAGQADGTVKLVFKRIPDTDEKVLEEPLFVMEEEAEYKDGKLTTTLRDVVLHDAWLVEVHH